MDNPNISWPGWETVRIIGRGSFGTVYEIRRQIQGRTEKAALKVICIPQRKDEIEVLRAENYDDKSITRYFAESRNTIENEYAIMAEMKGNSNIVYCDDIRSIQHDDGFGWDIFIKMELLLPFTKNLDVCNTEEQIIKLGIDICNALVACSKQNVVHRDIKPENIFISPDGNFKLGDFGIARTMESTTGGTKTGTYEYMAPEVYNNQPYHMGADIYSLGLVLYWLLNDRTGPFLAKTEKPTPSARAQARNRRFSGEPIPAPAHGSPQMQHIVLKACAFDPRDRFSSAAEMKWELEMVPREWLRPIESEADWTDEETTIRHPTPQPREPEPKEREMPASEEEKTMGVPDQADQERREQARKAEKARKAQSRKAKKSTKVRQGKRLAPVAVTALVLLAAVWMIAQGLKPDSGTTQTVPTVPSLETPVETTQSVAVTESEPQTLPPETTEETEPVQVTERTHQTMASGTAHSVALRSDGTVVAAGANTDRQCAVSDWRDIVSVYASGNNTAGLRADGTVVVTGSNEFGQCNVDDWTDITAVYFAGNYKGICTLGLRKDGTVEQAGSKSCEAGWNSFTFLRVQNWKDIVDIVPGYDFILGLKADGTVVTTGNDEYGRYGQCDVGSWRDIIQLKTSNTHTVGLRKDGTVVAVGLNDNGQCDVSAWRDIIAIDTGENCTIGLKKDGTVVAVGSNDNGQCDVNTWTDVTAIFWTGQSVGLRRDGTVLTAGHSRRPAEDIEGWTDIVAFVPGSTDLGLKSDGTVVAAGSNNYGQGNVGGWKDIRLPDGLEPRISIREETNQELQVSHVSAILMAASDENNPYEEDVVKISFQVDGPSSVWNADMLCLYWYDPGQRQVEQHLEEYAKKWREMGKFQYQAELPIECTHMIPMSDAGQGPTKYMLVVGVDKDGTVAAHKLVKVEIPQE